MDKSRILKIIGEAEAEIVTLEEALDGGNNDTANWTFVVLAGIIQDLQRLAEEEPIPKEVDKQKLSATFQTALKAVGERRASIEEGKYRLTRSDTVLLSLALHDIREIISTTSGVEVPNTPLVMPREQEAAL